MSAPGEATPTDRHVGFYEEDTSCTYCGGNGTVAGGDDPINDDVDRQGRFFDVECPACGGSGDGVDQVLW